MCDDDRAMAQNTALKLLENDCIRLVEAFGIHYFHMVDTGESSRSLEALSLFILFSFTMLHHSVRQQPGTLKVEFVRRLLSRAAQK